jgi:hypothetical protein
VSQIGDSRDIRLFSVVSWWFSRLVGLCYTYLLAHSVPACMIGMTSVLQYSSSVLYRMMKREKLEFSSQVF